MPPKDPKPPTSKWLKFEFSKLSASGKSEVWRVYSLDQWLCGTIEWFSHGQQYVFCPEEMASGFSGDCLRDIAKFLEWLNARKRPT